VADFCHFYGEDVPNYVPARSHMNPPLPPGFDCDTINADVLVKRLSVRQGRLTLPDGMSYRYLVLPHRKRVALSPPVLRKIAELVRQGATVIGPPPQRAPGLSNWPACDEEVRTLAWELWGPHPGAVGETAVGKGRVLWGRSPAAIVAADRLAPDIECRDLEPASVPRRFDGVTVPLDWIHRRDRGTDMYFVANIGTRPVAARVAFRTTAGAPQLWDPVSGSIRGLPAFAVEGARTVVPLEFEPKRSYFVVFSSGTAARRTAPAANFPAAGVVAEMRGPWQVSFDPSRGGPADVTFAALDDWTKRPEDGIRFYSGTATYRSTLDIPRPVFPGSSTELFLDLGRVGNLARVRLNGKDLGVVWTAPWRVDITRAARRGANELAIDVVNLWPNRLIGDAQLPEAQRRTRTNVRKFERAGLPLLESGLLGPVTLQAVDENQPVAP
jgi:hypothetical protein